MHLPHSEELEVQYLSRLFDNTSECYKFFWFQAIVTKILEGKNTITYEELIDEMIADAWYMMSSGIFIRQRRVLTAVRAIICRIGMCIFQNCVGWNICHIK